MTLDNSLTLKTDGTFDDQVTSGWSRDLAAAPTGLNTVVLDLSKVPSLSAAGATALGRWLSGPAGKKGLRFIVLCSPATEAAIETSGLGGVLECFPAAVTEMPRDLGPGAGATVAGELSALCGHLISGVERVTGTLFPEALSYHPPVASVADVTAELGPDVEGAFVRVETPRGEFRVLFLVKSGDKQELVRAFFRGRKVPDSATRDLVAELANNVLGDVIRHMAADDAGAKLKAEIPETLPPPAFPDEEELRRMGKPTLLSFLNGRSEIRLIVGYQAKC